MTGREVRVWMRHCEACGFLGVDHGFPDPDDPPDWTCAECDGRDFSVEPFTSGRNRRVGQVSSPGAEA